MRPFLAAVLVSLTFAGSAVAKPPERPPIPEEVTKACASLSQGDACTITMRGKTIQGTCEVLGEYGLACSPQRSKNPRK